MPLVTLYGTATCPYCIQAKRLLAAKGVKLQEIRVDLEPGQRRIMQTRSGRRTVPQIWIGEHHVGGFTDLRALEEKGQLDALLAADGAF